MFTIRPASYIPNYVQRLSSDTSKQTFQTADIIYVQGASNPTSPKEWAEILAGFSSVAFLALFPFAAVLGGGLAYVAAFAFGASVGFWLMHFYVDEIAELLFSLADKCGLPPGGLVAETCGTIAQKMEEALGGLNLDITKPESDFG